jgi:hypothetical protein
VIVVVPAVIPFTEPLMLMVAIAVLLLLHTPPAVALFNAVVAVAQTVAVPVIVPAAGAAFTVTTCVAYAVPQAVVAAYDIVAVPCVSPVTTPVVFTEAMALLLLLHIPPVVALLNEVVFEGQTVAVPVIVPAFGNSFTVMVVSVADVPQLFSSVYIMVAVPAVRPATVPFVPIVATAVLLLVQVPPLVALASVFVALGHTVIVPVIALTFGTVLTVAVVFVVAVPQVLVVVYVIEAVPVAMAVISPSASMVATAVLLLVHVPSSPDDVSVAASSSQSTVVPEIVPATGNGSISTSLAE